MEALHRLSAGSGLPPTFVAGFHVEEDVRRMPYRRLGHTDMLVSVLGYGGADFGSVYLATDSTSCTKALQTALKRGINYVDTAPSYGDSEDRLGEALKTVPRQSYFIGTKVGHYQTPEGKEHFDFSHDVIIQSVERSLQKLGLDYVDLLQLHDYEYARDVDLLVNESLPAMQKIRESGKARYIGINGYPTSIYKAVLERSTVHIDTVLSYNRCTMMDTSLLQLLPYFKEKGVGVINASPFVSGLLINREFPAWHPANETMQKNCRQAALYCQENGVDIAKLALNRTLELCNSSDIIATTLIGMKSPEQVDRNISALCQDLNENEVKIYYEVMERFIKPLQPRDWNDIVLAEFQKMHPESPTCWWWLD